MTLSRLSLTNFRCYQDALVYPSPGINILTGENGAGKTNILEAISLLTPGRGLRSATLGDMARREGPGGFAVAARVGDHDIGTGTLATAPERRVVRIDGATSAAGTLSEHLSIIWLTPAMDRLFSDSAGERRRFLDRLILALRPEHARHSSRYEAAMRQRNQLLGGDAPPDPAWLNALEEQMAVHGKAIGAARAEALMQLSARIDDAPEGRFARASLAIEGWNDQADLAEQLRESRARDAAAGRALVGPHRCDLAVTHRAKAQPAALCSTGEQKALLLGIILAHAELVAHLRKRRPLLLLDEVAAHLDAARRNELFERLHAGGGQVWVTGTDMALFETAGMHARRFMIAESTVRGL